MKVTPPVPIVDAKLISSTLAEPHAPAAYNAGTTYAYGSIVLVVADYTIYESLQASNVGHAPISSPYWWRVIGPTEDAYNAGTTYALGATVSSSTTHRCYESLQAGNVGHALPVLPETATAWWLDVGPTNKWAAFDLSRNTQSVQSATMTVVVAPGERINTLGLTGMVANAVAVSATSVTGGGTVFGPVPYDLNTRDVADAYDYCFNPFSTRPSKVIFDLPPFVDIVITVTLTATSGNVKLGSLVVGRSIDLGDVLKGTKNDGLNFSTVTRDLWGNATLVPRRTLPKTTQTTVIDSSKVNRALAARVSLNAAPALWSGIADTSSDWSEMLEILGIYTKFTVGDKELKAEINLEIEEI